MKILVTGGAGFIGSAACRLLVGEVGAEVLNVDKLTYAANPASLKPIEHDPRYRFHQGDIGDRAAIADLVRGFQPDAVLHLAAESHVDRSIDGPGAFIKTNIEGTYALLEAALDYWRTLPQERAARFRFHHVSTDEVFGSLGPQGRFREDARYQPSSPYSASKAGSDHLASAWYRTYELPVIICNASNNYGPYQFPEKLIPLAVLNALEEIPLPVYGDGSNVRDWLYVEDFVDGVLKLLDRGRPGASYNFGGGTECSNLQVAKRICGILDRIAPISRSRDSLITFVPDRPGHDLRYAIDATKAQRELDWRPRIELDRGLELTIHWYVENRAWWEPLRRNVYRGERLGLVDVQH